jgi:F0F1-type ATP synthase assembly protein I
MDNKNIAWWKPGLVIFSKVSASVAIPIVLALFIGKYLDKKYNSEPWIFLGLTAIAFIISIFSIWRNVKKYIDDLEKKEKEKRESQKELK